MALFVKEQIPWNKKEHIVKTCPQCGKGFTQPPCFSRVVFCSKECRGKSRGSPMQGRKHTLESKDKMAKARQGRFRGKACPAYKHGNSKPCRLAYSTIDYKNWRRTVFVRDSFTCAYCGATNVWIEAHHIKPQARFPELRFAIDNGITLCKSCHREMHRRREGKNE